MIINFKVNLKDNIYDIVDFLYFLIYGVNRYIASEPLACIVRDSLMDINVT